MVAAFPHEQQGPCTGFFSLRRPHAIGNTRRWKLSPAGGSGFSQADKSLEIYSLFRRDGADGISCYLAKLMKSNLFFFLLKIKMPWENCILCLVATGSSPE